MRRIKRVFPIMIVASASIVVAFAANAAETKFRPARGQEPVVGRYLVRLDPAIAAEGAGTTAQALMRAYSGQLELSASSDERTFSVTMLPSRARSLSADPRVREVVEVVQDERDAPPANGKNQSVASRHLVPIAQESSSSGTYLYDGAGNIKSIGSDVFAYDVLGRLKEATLQVNNVSNYQSYTYDSFGNRTGATRSAPVRRMCGKHGLRSGCQRQQAEQSSVWRHVRRRRQCHERIRRRLHVRRLRHGHQRHSRERCTRLRVYGG
jgi:hypothetical protein